MDKKLTLEQKNILLEEGTEPPGTSHLHQEKREGDYYCAGCNTKLFESKKNMKVDLGGHLFLNLYQMYLKQRPIIHLA